MTSLKKNKQKFLKVLTEVYLLSPSWVNKMVAPLCQKYYGYKMRF